MTNKLVVIINSLKVPKIKKLLLYEMKFLVPNYSCLQNPWLGGYRPQIPVLSVLNWICWTPLNKIPGYATDTDCFMWCSWHSSNSCLPADRHFRFCISDVCNLCGLQGKGGWKANVYVLSMITIKRAVWIITQRHSRTTSQHATCVHRAEVGNQNVTQNGFIHVSRHFLCI